MTTEFGKLRGSGITKQLPRREMEQTIETFLKENNVCVLATTDGRRPRATPIEYYSRGTTIYLSAGPGIKRENLKTNSHVSVAIYNTPYTDWNDWYRVKGIQITGTATLITSDDPEYREALNIYDWRLYLKAMGKDINETPMGRHIIKIVAERVEYRDLGLMRRGYSAKQLWEAGKQ